MPLPVFKFNDDEKDFSEYLFHKFYWQLELNGTFGYLPKTAPNYIYGAWEIIPQIKDMETYVYKK